MRKYILVMLCAVGVVGCLDLGQQTEEPVAKVLSLTSIPLGAQGELVINGELVAYTLRQNEKGKVRRYVVASPETHVALERATSWELAAKGYERRVRREEKDRYLVRYVIRGQPDATLLVDYTPWDEFEAKSRMTLTVPVAGN